MSLYLKYRPQNFDTLIGQSHVIRVLKNALIKNQLTHAYLFSGPRGTGKTSTARILAKSLNCLSKEHIPCNQCSNCLAILNQNLVDLIEIDGASNRGIDEIRDLREKVQFTPTQGKVKIYIIDEVHMLTKEAFNALLKTLEEPPVHAYFILATTEIHKIPDTILSRCQSFSFKRIHQNEITSALAGICKKESIEYEEGALNIIAKTALGGMRDAIGLLEKLSLEGSLSVEGVKKHLGFTDEKVFDQLLSCILHNKLTEGIEYLNGINSKGVSLNEFCNGFIQRVRKIMLEKAKKNESSELHIKIIENFLVAKQQIHSSPLPILPLEIAMIKSSNILHPKDVGSISDHEDQNKPLDKPHQPEKKTSEENKVAEETAIQNKPFPVEQNEEITGTLSTPCSSVEIRSIKVDVKEVSTINNEPIANKTEEGKISSTTINSAQEFDQPKNITPSKINLDTLSKKWNLIVQEIKTPVLKMSFMGGSLISADDNGVLIHFKSKTLMEKVQEPQCFVEVEKAFESILGLVPRLKVDFKPFGENLVPTATPQTQNSLEAAKEVFDSVNL